MSRIHFIPVGGIYEFGNQGYLYGVDDEWILVDAGSQFSSDDRTYHAYPDYSFVDALGEKLKALIITHNHEDHLGGITRFMTDHPHVPVYCTPFVEAHIGLKIAQQDLRLKLKRHPVSAVPQGQRQKIGTHFNMEFIAVNHSTPESSMIYLETPYGNVLHTGDWRYERNPVGKDRMNWKRLEEISAHGLTALVADSTGILNDTTEPLSELDVKKSLFHLFRQTAQKDKVLIATTFSTHTDRINSLCEIARHLGREPKFVGTGMQANSGVSKKCGFLHEKRIVADGWMNNPKSFYIATGCQAEENSAMDLFAQGAPLKRPTCILFSARVIPGEEEKVAAMKAVLRAKGYDLIENDATHLTHVSGHAPRVDTERLIQLMKPRIYIPIHGNEDHLKANVRLGRKLHVPCPVLLEKCGEQISFSKTSEPVSEQLYTPVKVVVHSKERSFEKRIFEKSAGKSRKRT